MKVEIRPCSIARTLTSCMVVKKVEQVENRRRPAVPLYCYNTYDSAANSFFWYSVCDIAAHSLP